jgi:hypothetical protein
VITPGDEGELDFAQPEPFGEIAKLRFEHSDLFYGGEGIQL